MACGCGGSGGGNGTLLTGSLDQQFLETPPPSTSSDSGIVSESVTGGFGSWLEFGVILAVLLGAVFVLDVSIRRAKEE
jgi:hypothetical protein